MMQSPRVKMRDYIFYSVKRQNAYMLSDSENQSYGGKPGRLYVSLFKNGVIQSDDEELI